MPNRLYYALSALLIFILYFSPANAQQTKSILLNQVDSLAMPQPPDQMSVFLIINDQPEVIATLKTDYQEQIFVRCNTIVSSTLGKGKILAIGTSGYFKAAMLGDKNIAQLLKNTIHWAKPGDNKPIAAIAGNPESGLEDLLKQQNITFYVAKNLELKKGTDLLFLNRDVRDDKQLNQIKTFITNGGTLIFASPYADYYNGADSIKNLGEMDLHINKMLAEAGIVNPNAVIDRTLANTRFLTDSVPDYVQIKTLLPAIQDNTTYNPGITFLNDLTIDQALKYNDIKSPIIARIKQSMGVPDQLPLPSRSNPVLNNTPTLKARNLAAYNLYNRQQDFSHHPLAKALGRDNFPGAIPINAPRITETVNIAVHVGSQGFTDNLTEIQTRLHSTGLYVPAGEKVTITIDNALIQRGLTARIGVHSDNVTNLDQFTRIPLNLTNDFKLDKKSVDVFSPYGGLLLIGIKDTSTLKTVQLKIKGAVKAPYFKLGETDEKEWNASIRNNPAPWAQLATDNIILTVPAYRIRKLDNPVKLMQFWDEVMNADADLAGMPQKRKHAENIIIDNDVAYGYMFTLVDKITAPDDESCEWMLNEPFIRSHGSWGTFHELGHRHQYWPFEDGATQEVTVNLYTMYVYDKVLHQGIYRHEGMETKELVIAKIKDYLSNAPDYQKWRNDPFVALSMYIEIINTFGWDAIKAVNATYRNTPKSQFPANDQQKVDFRFTTLCKATNSNLTRFFEVWRIPISAEAKNQVKGYKEWFPEELAAYK